MGNKPTAVEVPPGLQGEATFKQYPLNQSEELKTQKNTNFLRDPAQPVPRHSSKQASRLARSDTTDVHQRRTSALRFGPFPKQNSMGNKPTAVQVPPGLQGEAAFKQYPLNQSEELKTQKNTNVLRDPSQPVSRHSSKQASIPAQTVAFSAQRHQAKLHSIPLQPATVPQGVMDGVGYPSQTAQPVLTYPPQQQVPQYAAPKQSIRRPSQVQQPKRPSTTTQAGVPLKSNLKRISSINLKGPQHTQPGVNGSVTVYSQ
uniref:Uncharacterized protein n=1 Tax=Chromera velia CCMP2878 TaxID=1169474 RepID=A0A0K6S9Y2_9ALVE|eukprot:Cvel_9059.t1-p1 / transcript=Cvel_9059.t1 / gene=Cvel_9059 / organism=Chromera_velia_CCMP2878 / gene_product=hypothetical protein / transcript_product=hypothetical protein / location=Cvel_scaffold513:78344-79114(+) / protein_length=257 / sequence_SO=supercontig / SO=protein_coding / is_pseudo=false